MPKFLSGNSLNLALENLFLEAQSQIILISPYIKLHDRYASALQTKRDNADIKIIVVFGKNENDISKSLIEEDFNFFKQFPNIEIRYESKLHAKYYANEKSAVLTSMNLHSYSQNNNIEAGVLTTRSLFGDIAKSALGNISDKSFDDDAYDYFERVCRLSELFYLKTPNYESGFLGFGKKYKNSTVKTDKLSLYFSNKSIDSSPREKETIELLDGYCIRTGKKIPFNLNMPMTYDAYEIWSAYKNENFEEKYCHLTGEKSNGETTFAKPILKKNWIRAKDKLKL
ncbi:MAG: phospholipase D family protein [Bacteroidia bacterium]